MLTIVNAGVGRSGIGRKCDDALVYAPLLQDAKNCPRHCGASSGFQRRVSKKLLFLHSKASDADGDEVALLTPFLSEFAIEMTSQKWGKDEILLKNKTIIAIKFCFT